MVGNRLIILGMAFVFGAVMPVFAVGNTNLDDWTVEGNVVAATGAAGGEAVLFQEMDAGGLSRVFRVSPLPDTPTVIAFRYRLAPQGGPRLTALPPDSFTAFLLGPDGPPGERLVVPDGADPAFSLGFLYADSDGRLVYDDAYVTVSSEPDAEGMRTVLLDVSSLTGGQETRLEFGLASAQNGVYTTAIVADVRDCCCVIDADCDDGDPCTEDACSVGLCEHHEVCPPNDDCTAGPIPIIGEGVFEFDNSLATRDGPDHFFCDFSGDPAFDHDVWFCWTSTCPDAVIFETCGLTDVDTKIAVYPGCTCRDSDTPPWPECNDEACGLQSFVWVNRQVEPQSLVRIATKPGMPGGPGAFRITCTAPDR